MLVEKPFMLTRTRNLPAATPSVNHCEEQFTSYFLGNFRSGELLCVWSRVLPQILSCQTIRAGYQENNKCERKA